MVIFSFNFMLFLQELEEEHESLNQELQRVNAENRSLLEMLKHLQSQISDKGEPQVSELMIL